jgi:hypothetical protein
MSRHVKDAALRRYGLTLDDNDVAGIQAQCRSGRRLLHVHERDNHGPTEHHAVVVRGVAMCVACRAGTILTVLPRDRLPLDGETAIAAAFRRAMGRGVEA